MVLQCGIYLSRKLTKTLTAIISYDTGNFCHIQKYAVHTELLLPKKAFSIYIAVKKYVLFSKSLTFFVEKCIIELAIKTKLTFCNIANNY